MEMKEMKEVIMSAKPGDKLQVVFADKTFNGDLKGLLYHVLAMCVPIGKAISVPEMAMLTLKAVADSGRWENCLNYTFTVLNEFDAEYFAHRTLNHEMLESISLTT